MTTITAIHSGEDWYDASANYVVLPEGMDVQAENKAYYNWLHNVYRPKGTIPFRTFSQWLIDFRGARYPTDDELQVFVA